MKADVHQAWLTWESIQRAKSPDIWDARYKAQVQAAFYAGVFTAITSKDSKQVVERQASEGLADALGIKGKFVLRESEQ